MNLAKAKHYAQQQHFKNRFKERIGIEVDTKSIKEMIFKIQKGSARFVKKRSNRVKVFEVDYKSQKIWLVYDKIRKNLVTVLLPKNSNQEEHNGINRIRISGSSVGFISGS